MNYEREMQEINENEMGLSDLLTLARQNIRDINFTPPAMTLADLPEGAVLFDAEVEMYNLIQKMLDVAGYKYLADKMRKDDPNHGYFGEFMVTCFFDMLNHIDAEFREVKEKLDEDNFFLYIDLPSLPSINSPHVQVQRLYNLWEQVEDIVKKHQDDLSYIWNDYLRLRGESEYVPLYNAETGKWVEVSELPYWDSEVLRNRADEIYFEERLREIEKLAKKRGINRENEPLKEIPGGDELPF